MTAYRRADIQGRKIFYREAGAMQFTSGADHQLPDGRLSSASVTRLRGE